jgi:hypothetical protein
MMLLGVCRTLLAAGGHDLATQAGAAAIYPKPLRESAAQAWRKTWTYVDVTVERWHTETGREAILDCERRTFEEVKSERLGKSPSAPEETDAAVDDAGETLGPQRRKSRAA